MRVAFRGISPFSMRADFFRRAAKEGEPRLVTGTTALGDRYTQYTRAIRASIDDTLLAHPFYRRARARARIRKDATGDSLRRIGSSFDFASRMT